MLRTAFLAIFLAAAAQEKKEENDTRFHPVLLSVAKTYEKFGRVDDAIRFAPWLCWAPPPGPPLVSGSKDTDTHGRKLYFLYAYDAAAYLKKPEKDPFKNPLLAPKHDAKPAEQVLIKQSWTCVPIDRDDKWVDPIDGGIRGVAKDGKWFKAGERKDLFVMVKFDEKTEGTDKGWVYGTVTPDGKTVTSSGRVPSCMSCHETAGTGRLFGLPKK